MLRPALALATIAIFATCASAGGSGSGGDPDVITRADVEATAADNAFQVVRRLHPDWLITRGQATLDGGEEIVVYYNNSRMGGPDALRRIQTGNIQEIRFYSASEAQFKWGSGHLHGAIQVVTGTGTSD